MPRRLKNLLSLLVAVGLLSSLAIGCGSSDPADPVDDGGGGGGGGGGGIPNEDTSSFGVIDDAVLDGDITVGQGLLYKLQAVFEPDRLPTAFQGGTAFAAESTLYDDLAATLDQVTGAERDAILPYLYAPFYAGSWWDLRQKRLSVGTEAPGSPETKNLSGDIIDSWLKIDTADGRVRVWYESAVQQPYAQAVATAMSTVVWDKLTNLMGRDPLGDGTHGGDSRYDFVVMPLDPALFGLCNQVFGLLDLIPSCDESPTYIQINTAKAIDSVPSTVAHEFMHALQRSFDFNGCDEYRWLREATATWAMDYCYPADDFESRRVSVAGKTLPRHFLDAPGQSLDIWNAGGSPYSYGAYLFFQYLSKSFSPDWIRYIWQAGGAGDSALAVENGLKAAGTTNLEERWPQFARFLWNQDPFPKLDEWDNLTETPAIVRGTIGAIVSSSDYSDSVRMDISLPRLSSNYYRISLPDGSVSGFYFVNGWNYNIETYEWNDYNEPGLMGLRAQPLSAADAKGRTVDLLYKVTGQDWVSVDLSHSPGFLFCRDVAGGDVEQAVLVFSNGDVTATDGPKEPLGMEPFIWYDNVGCGKWDGTLSWDAGDGDVVYRIDANYTWDTGAGDAGGFFLAPPDDQLEEWHRWVLEPVSGSMTWTMSSSYFDCSYNGTETWALDEINTMYDEVTLRNFVLEGDYERTVTAQLMSTFDREVTEVITGVDCGENFTYPLGVVLESPHSNKAAKISSDGSRIDVVYQEDEGSAVFELHLVARK